MDENYIDSDDESIEEKESTKPIKKINNIPSIITIYNTYFNRNNINLKPNYQRELTWSFDKMCVFIDSIMKGYVIPSFILSTIYKKNNDNYNYECIDGQHRLTVLKKYMNSEFIKIGPYEKYIYFEKYENNKKIKIFYQLNNNIKQKYKNCREMTNEEKMFFEDTQLQFVIIESDITDIQKCDIFNRLQNGEKVNGITKVKNINHKITDYLRNNNIITNIIVNEFKDIIKNKIVKRNTEIFLIEYYTYLLIRLIVIYDKKNFEINFLNLNIKKYLINNTSSMKIKGDMDNIYTNIIKHKNEIKDKINFKLIPELFLIIFFIKVYNEEIFNLLNKKSIDLLNKNYNSIDSYRINEKSIVSKESIMLNYDKIKLLITENNK